VPKIIRSVVKLRNLRLS